jgi:hypothetical protein
MDNKDFSWWKGRKKVFLRSLELDAHPILKDAKKLLANDGKIQMTNELAEKLNTLASKLDEEGWQRFVQRANKQKYEKNKRGSRPSLSKEGNKKLEWLMQYANYTNKGEFLEALLSKISKKRIKEWNLIKPKD